MVLSLFLGPVIVSATVCSISMFQKVQIYAVKMYLRVTKYCLKMIRQISGSGEFQKFIWSKSISCFLFLGKGGRPQFYIMFFVCFHWKCVETIFCDYIKKKRSLGVEIIVLLLCPYMTPPL